MPEKTCIKHPPYDKLQIPAKYKTNNKSPKPYMLNHHHWLKTASLPGHDRVSPDLLRSPPTLPGVALSHRSPEPQKKNPPTTSVLGLLHLQTCRTQRTLPSFAASSGQTCFLRPQQQQSLYVKNVPRAGNPLGSCLSPFPTGDTVGWNLTLRTFLSYVPLQSGSFLLNNVDLISDYSLFSSTGCNFSAHFLPKLYIKNFFSTPPPVLFHCRPTQVYYVMIGNNDFTDLMLHYWNFFPHQRN